MTKSQSNTLFKISIALFAIGIFFFFTFWLMLFGFGLMGVGIILSLLSKKNWKYQALVIGLPIGFVVFAFIKAIAIPERFLIPEDFRGVVYVVFDQKDGKEKEFEGFRRIYRVPNNGVLFTKFSENQGLLNQDFYFIKNDGSREKMDVLDVRDFNENHTTNPNPSEPSRDRLAVFNPGTMGQTTTSKNEKQYIFTAFTVGKYKDIVHLNYLDKEYIKTAKMEQNKE
jgi:hypothetical protein